MKIKSKKILIVSSKFPPNEYSGSGLRAYNTYSRLKKKYGLKWDAVVNSLSTQGNKYFFLNDNLIYRISSPFKKKIKFFFQISSNYSRNYMANYIFNFFFNKK